jgi:hypothetical protein
MSSTTSHFQIKPDYYSSAEECLVKSRETYNTNPRYKFYNQTHFTAGDINQFEEYRDSTNGKLYIQDISFEDNVFKDTSFSFSEKYRNINTLSVDDTFNYMFHKFKKGIFIKIKNGELRVFLPFSKKNFTNEWFSQIKIDPKYKDMNEFFNLIQTSEKRKFNLNSINRFIDSWYGNNCLLRWEFPLSEGDTNIPNLSDMLKVLCKERELPDMEFFVNRRDFPLLKNDNTEPYDHIFGDDTKLLSHSYDKFCPILSMVGKENYADIPIPTGEDWARVCNPESKFFQKYSSREFKINNIPWNSKRPTAVFRGASTGVGVTIDTNPRLKISYLSKITKPDCDGIPLLDAGITDWKLRPRKIKGNPYLQTIDVNSLPFGLVEKLSMQQQAEYKYVVNIDGHVSAFRLSLELELGFCILLVESEYKLWYRRLLKPYVHYIPVKKDLSDLISKIKWCKEHDKECEIIAQNAKSFAKKHLTKEGILDYMQKLLFDLKKFNGVYMYNYITPKQILDVKKSNYLSELEYQEIKSDIYSLPSYERSYSLLQAIGQIINSNEIHNSKLLFKNRNTIITECELNNISLVRKVSENNLLHEAFVTLFVTNEFSKFIPNFCYTFTYKEKELLKENVLGNTLSEHIKKINFDSLISILIQISLALEFAQKRCKFVHNDLTPWNIIIQKLPKPIKIDYPIDDKTVYSITTDEIPVIIDMGRSHVVYDNIHYGEVNPFTFSSIQDIITLLDVVIYEISKNELKSDDVKKLICLANFLSGTQYRKKPFLMTGKNGLGDLRYFFGKAKKYSEIVSSDKKDLENKTPVDFLTYLCKHFKNKLNITISSHSSCNYNRHSVQQIIDYTLSRDDEARCKTYLGYFKRVLQTEIYIDKPFQAYYIFQEIYSNVTSVYEEMTRFLEERKDNNTSYNKLYQKVLKKLHISFNSIIRDEELVLFDNNIEDIIFDETTFLKREEIKNIINTVPYHNNRNSDIVNILRAIMINNGPFKVKEKDRKYYDKLLSECIEDNSNLNTFFYITDKIYEKNVEMTKGTMYEDQCKDILDMLKIKMKDKPF